MTREELRKFEPLWDKWYVQEHLGGGSYGDVYRITCQVYERTYEAALKVISIPKDQSELNEVELNCETKEDTITYFDQIRQSITSEIDMMEQLKGRTNIVSFEDHDIIPHNNGKDPGYDIFIRMELLEDFSSVIGRESKQWTDNRQIVKMGMDIAEGIRICHTHNIIHRDIKLGNIFRSKDGDYKIGDFGIARNVSDAQLTMSIKGTFNYMAPEVYNREHYDFRADIYSLGMVMYHMLNKNRGPFLPLTEVPTAEQKDRALIRRMAGEQLNAPVLAGQKLGEIIMKACEFRKEDRFQSMEEFYQALLMLSAEDMERSGVPLADNEQISSDAEEAVPEDDATVAFVDAKNDSNIGTSQEQLPEDLSVEEEDDRTVAMQMPEQKTESEREIAFELSKPEREKVSEPPKAENGNAIEAPKAEYRETKTTVEKARLGRKQYLGIAGIAVAALCVIIGLAGALPNKSDKADAVDVAQESQENLSPEPAVDMEEQLAEELPVEPEAAVEEVTAPVVPFCSEEVTVKGGKKTGGLIYEGDDLDNLKIQGEFQASETDNTKVEGTLVLDYSEKVIKSSGEYEWTFTPDDTEHYETVTGKVHITAIHKDLINGMDELEQIEDKAAVYQLALTDCGLKDLTILEGMTNLAVLVVSDNNITDLTELAKHPRLQQIYLDGNAGLKDIEPLLGLKNLSIVELSGTAVSEEDKNALEKKLVE